jgi:hypothetical protein
MRPIAVALAGAVGVALFAIVAASAGAFNSDEPYKALVKTKDNAEQTDYLDITQTQGESPKVVMSLQPPSLSAGDRLNLSSELEVTTDCFQNPDHCALYSDGRVGLPYNFNPRVDTQLVLASTNTDTCAGGPSATCTPINDLKELRCRQRLPDRNHHCVLVFPEASFDVPEDASALACLPNDCHVNLVASAWNDNVDDQYGYRLIVGEDEPDGSTVQDKGRINAVRLHPDPEGTGPVRSYSTADPVATSLQVGDQSTLNHTVIFSQPLQNLKDDEQLAVSANMNTDNSALPYNTLIQSKLILTDGHRATTVSDAARKDSTLNGEIAEGNGFNCTHLQFTSLMTGSPWDNPCLTQKVGVIRMIKDGDKLFVNLVVGTKAVGGATPTPGDAIQVTGGDLQVVRYSASRKG